MLGEPSICFERSVRKCYIFDDILLERIFLWTVVYEGKVKYSVTEIRNLYVIVFEFVIHGAFYYVVVSEFRTHGTE